MTTFPKNQEMTLKSPKPNLRVQKDKNELYSKDINKRVDKRLDSMIKESCMNKEKFREAKGIALEMKGGGKIEVILDTPLLVVVEGVTLASPSAQIQVQPIVVQPTQTEKDEEEVKKIEVQK